MWDALSCESDHRLELEHLLDAECDRRAVAPRHAAIRIKDDVEPLAPQRRRDAEGVRPLALVPAGDDHGLRRAGLAEVPGAEGDAVGGDELHLLGVSLKLKGGEREVVEEGRLRGHKRPPVDAI